MAQTFKNDDKGLSFFHLEQNIISCWINYILTRSKEEESIGTIEALGSGDLHHFLMFQHITEKERESGDGDEKDGGRGSELKECESDFDLWPEGCRMLNLDRLLLTLHSTLPQMSMIKIHYFTF